jgi:formylglycine-generating enzyme required for sulfatase activity
MRAFEAVLSVALVACSEPTPQDLPEMVEVPAGDTVIGCAEECGPGVIPLQVVSIGFFEIDRVEVTVGDWQACAAAFACEEIACEFARTGSLDEPMGCVTQAQAQTFCAWKQKRLPHELEWEKAARGPDGQRYPWGETGPGEDCSLANYECGNPPMDVGSLPAGASPYGMLDAIGNVAEFTIPWDVVTNPDTFEVWRGGDSIGSFFHMDVEAQASSRAVIDIVNTSHPMLGFRCAR